jgi:endonuclease/exonuclease/phosphatase family metal-dependent hydrolase
VRARDTPFAPASFSAPGPAADPVGASAPVGSSATALRFCKPATSMMATASARPQGSPQRLNRSGSDYSIWSLADTASQASSGDAWSLRLASYNLHGWRDTHHFDNLQRLKDTLGKINADVVALQEVLHPFRPPSDAAAAQAYFDRVKAGKGNGFVPDYLREDDVPYLQELADELGLPFISFGKATDDGYFGMFGYGNAILSRFPIVREEHHVVKPAAHHQVGRRIEAEDRCISIVTLQTTPLTQQSFCVTHLDQLSDELRVEQLTEMLSFANSFGDHIMCGDFNAFQRLDCTEEQWQLIQDDAASKNWPQWPETNGACELVAKLGYRDAFYLSDNHISGAHDSQLAIEGSANDTKKPGPTCWVVKPLLRIDYVFLSQGMRDVNVEQYQRIMDEGSDHFPIAIDLLFSGSPCSGSPISEEGEELADN